ncbi:hypothetical protein COOONC_07711 [Cooperia oncophora]
MADTAEEVMVEATREKALVSTPKMADAAEEVMVEATTEKALVSTPKVEDEISGILSEIVDRVVLWGDPSSMEMDFFSLDYRRAPSMASASSASGSEFGDLSDSELPVMESDEDSDLEFEKLQTLSCEWRLKKFQEEHPSGVPKQKRLRTEKKVYRADLEHDYDNLPPLENLSIHCAESIPLEPIGHVTSIVDCLGMI